MYAPHDSIQAYYQSSLVNQNTLLRDGTYQMEIISASIIIVSLHTNNRKSYGVGWDTHQ